MKNIFYLSFFSIIIIILIVFLTLRNPTGNFVSEPLQVCTMIFIGDNIDPQSVCDDAFIDPDANDYIRNVFTNFDGRVLSCGVPCGWRVKEQCWSSTGMFISYVDNNPRLYKVLTPAVDAGACSAPYSEAENEQYVSEDLQSNYNSEEFESEDEGWDFLYG